MGEDEVGTHERLMAYRQIMDDLVGRHDGRVVGSAGDAVLADFPSVIEALSAAVDIQEELTNLNAALPSQQMLEFRIGINLGDVIVDGDDIFGDGVNVAARVQSLADRGGISISGAVYDQVKNKLDLVFQDRGPHRIKNIAEPVRVYAIGGTGRNAGPPLIWRQHRRAIAAAGSIILVVAIVATLWRWGPIADRIDPRPATSGGSPTVAVLPFEDRSGDPTQSCFNDGVTEDVIVDLGRFSSLLVLSWNAVAPYKGRDVPLEQLSSDLNVRYVVGGTVRRVQDRLRVTVQLTDTERGVLLWSKRYDEGIDDIFAVQDQIAREVVGALAVRLTDLERDRAFEKPTENVTAYDYVLRGRDLLRRVERTASLDARAMFERARELDPAYGDAYVGLAASHTYDFMVGWSEWPRRAIEQAQELAEYAIQLNERSAMAHAWLAIALLYQREYERAERAIERSIDLNPNNAMGLAVRGALMVLT